MPNSTKAYNASILSDYINPTGLAVFPSTVRVSGSLLVQDVPVSVSGHNHAVSDIVNFDSTVSGLLPNNIVTGVGTNGYSAQWNSNNSLTSGIIFSDQNNVGIGTTTPNSTLHVIGSGIFTSGVRVGDSAANSYIIGPSGNTYIRFNSGANNSINIGSNTTTGSSAYLDTQFTYLNSQATYVNGSFTFPAAGNNPTNTATQQDSNSIRLFNKLWDGSAVMSPANEIVSKASTTSNLSSRLAFFMQNGDGTQNRTERVSISNNGNVGIGTTNPQNLIHISGSTANAAGIRIDNADGMAGRIDADNGALYFSSSTATVCRMQASKIRLGDGVTAAAIELTANGTISQDGNGGGLSFSGTTARLSNGMHITGGSLGVGTTSPSGQLHVIGTGLFSENLLINNVPVSISGHNHISSDITNFNSSVSGLIPIKSISPGTNISITNNSGDYTIGVSGSLGLTTEEVDDRIASLLVAGTGIHITYNDSANILTINTSGLQPSGNYSLSDHNHVASNITDFNTSVSGLINGIYATLDSPALIGTPTAPTAASGTNTTQIASTQFVRTEISNLVSSAPSTLDTLNELATALGNDANFSTTVTNSLAGKANLSGASFTGNISAPSGDFSSSLKVNNVEVSVNTHTHGNISSSGTIGSTANLPLITMANGLIITGVFGSSANTFCEGNDSRLSNARTPLSHTHGNITNDGSVGSTANLPLITTTAGAITTGTFGTTANTFCQGNDSRLSDTRTPTDNTVSTAKIVNSNVTYAKIQNISATDRLLGRSSAGAGAIEEIVCTTFGRSLIDDTDAATARTTLVVPSRTGGDASGTWSISITGNSYGSSYQLAIGTANNFNTNFSETPAHARSFREMSADGPQGVWWFVENLRHSNNTGQWGRQNAWGWEDNANELWSRNVQNGSWGSWVRFLHSGNYNSYTPTLTGTGASGTWGISITGSASNLTSATNSAQLYANDASYGSWRVGGSRNGWAGLEFNSTGAGNISLMMNSGHTGCHNNTYGWQWYWTNGSFYVSKGAYGGSSVATVLDSSNYPSFALQSLEAGGRLTLESNVPVSTLDHTAKTVLYYTPYNGNRLPLYNSASSRWEIHSFSEISLSLGTLTSGLNYDVFIYDSSGTKLMELVAWTNDSTRSEALGLQDGIYVRLNNSAKRYLGTIRTTSTTTTEDSESRRFVWNINNKEPREMAANISAIHTYTSTAVRPFNNSQVVGSTRTEFVLGIADRLDCSFHASIANSATVGLSIDSTSSYHHNSLIYVNTGASAIRVVPSAYTDRLTAGFHYLLIVEAGNGSSGTFNNASIYSVVFA